MSRGLLPEIPGRSPEIGRPRVLRTICDLSPFYCDAGGGIRTCHRARLAWFAGQQRYRYVLIAPGPRLDVQHLSPWSSVVRVFGPRLTRERDGYRLLLAFRDVAALVRDLRPDVLETGDPWISGPLGLWLRRRRAFNGLLTSFFHSDPIATYVEPWLGRRAGDGRLHRSLVRVANRSFFRLQRTFDLTLAGSAATRERLVAYRVTNIAAAPMGADREFFDAGRARRRREWVGVLYAGRLDADKESPMLLGTIERLLRLPGVRVTVAGRGRHERAFARLTHPNYAFRGYIRERATLADMYAEHDIFLAPGRYETFGLGALEAAAAGLVVVGPDAGGTGDLLREMASPFTFGPGDADGFLDRTRAAIESDRRPHVERARAVAARHGTWPDAVERQVALYSRAIAARGCR
jgi:alpha-1,6-mannosyltransferase